jgi:hypothetical protein
MKLEQEITELRAFETECAVLSVAGGFGEVSGPFFAVDARWTDWLDGIR